ncbi:MAG: UDP-glucose/GDP-mannose dehydrogenase family protein [Candidatus Coatesbacteria bacterium]
MNLTVVGAGYVGLVTSACFADLGHRVTCVDIDRARIRLLNRGKVPIFEPGLEELLARNRRQKRLVFTTSLGPAVRASQIIFIAVGTPPKPNGEADLSQVESVARDIGRHLNGDKVIVNKSTVPVGMGDVVASIIRNCRGGRHRFAVASNPEFLREGSAVWDFMNPDRIVIGAGDAKTADTVAQLFRPINAPRLVTDIRSAEMIKVASNAFLATKISFINEIAALCDRVGADVGEVSKGVGMDKRIGGAFLSAGAGYGGSCFPKDTLALIAVMEREGLAPRILKATTQVNTDQRRRILEKLKAAAGPLEGRTVAVWGLAFKANTDDMREAVSVDIIRALREMGARVKAYDPAAMPKARALLPGITFAKDPYDAVRDADALLILTEWNQFKEADLKRVKALLRRPVIVDGRNLCDLEAVRALGFTYRGVGRGARA